MSAYSSSSMDPSAVTEADAVAEIAERAVSGEELTPESVLAYVVRTEGGGQRVEVVDGEQYGAAPHRSKAGRTVVRDVDSLVLLAQRWGTPDSTVVYADPLGHKIEAVLNDDTSAERPAWRDRRVSVALAHTPEWAHWAGKDNVLMTQADFAQHVEDGLVQVQEPAAADLYEVAKTLESTTSVDFRSAVRLEDGQRQFAYTETSTARAGQAGQLAVPDLFVLGLQPWHGTPAYKVRARLRYRITDTGLRLGYRLDNPERVLLDAFEALLQPARDLGYPLVTGSP